MCHNGIDMGHHLDIRQITDDTHVKRSVLYILTSILDRCPSHALGQHHPSHHGVQPVLVLYNAIVRSSPPHRNQEGNGQHQSTSMCESDASPIPTSKVSLYATLAGASPFFISNRREMDLLLCDTQHKDRLNTERHHPASGETRKTSMLCSTSWQGRQTPSRDTVGRPSQPRTDVINPCAIPEPEMTDRRTRPTMPYTRYVPQSARPQSIGVFLTAG